MPLLLHVNWFYCILACGHYHHTAKNTLYSILIYHWQMLPDAVYMHKHQSLLFHSHGGATHTASSDACARRIPDIAYHLTPSMKGIPSSYRVHIWYGKREWLVKIAWWSTQSFGHNKSTRQTHSHVTVPTHCIGWQNTRAFARIFSEHAVYRPWFAKDESKLLARLTYSWCVDYWSQLLYVLSHHLSVSHIHITTAPNHYVSPDVHTVFSFLQSSVRMLRAGIVFGGICVSVRTKSRKLQIRLLYCVVRSSVVELYYCVFVYLLEVTTRTAIF